MNTDFTLIQIKRSDVEGRVPTVDDLELGEIAINTYDAKLFAKRFRSGVGVDIIAVGGSGPDIENVLYVTADGNDSNSGKKLGDGKRTIAAAIFSGIPNTRSVNSVITAKVPSEPTNNRVRSYPADSFLVSRPVLIIVPSAITAVNAKTLSRIDP